MDEQKLLLYKLKPGVSKQLLFFIAALIWTFAGVMLLFKGYQLLSSNPENIWIKLTISIICGVLFYVFIFSGISYKHSTRIKLLVSEKPCAFSFFNWKSYLMMSLMITMGIGLRISGIVSAGILSILYITMGIPLLTSALRFYSDGYNFNNTINKK